MIKQNKDLIKQKIDLFTDGACLGNPGPGGWGVILCFADHETTLSGYEPNTTNNRMELTAAIKGLESLEQSSQICLYTDSQYLKNGITQWIERWKINGWYTSEGTPVKNQDLWQHLDALISYHDIEFIWLRAHAGHPKNEHADRLARARITHTKTE